MKGRSFGFGEGGGVVGGAAKFGGLLEETGGGKMVGREALAEEGGAEGFAVGRVIIHQGFELGGEVGHAQAKLAREVAVGDGFARSREGCEAGFKPCAVQGRWRFGRGQPPAGRTR